MNSLIKKEMLSVRIPIELNKQLTTYTKKIGISKSALILLLISKELANNDYQKGNLINDGA
ncbi:MAG TPA: hypothetical protein H9979_05350 [Candidatus Megamonas gallistercoris]|uniref:hypothetical protein n=1 Tax=Megamonas hypermegale TaxID=158847 RepID=UPI001C39EF9A|nr:hypothetical protein [Megamonas hypermegale]HIX83950.1 hypothetical protein [Candidatus Megamonas gallistercoris]